MINPFPLLVSFSLPGTTKIEFTDPPAVLNLISTAGLFVLSFQKPTARRLNQYATLLQEGRVSLLCDRDRSPEEQDRLYQSQKPASRSALCTLEQIPYSLPYRLTRLNRVPKPTKINNHSLFGDASLSLNKAKHSLNCLKREL